MARRRRIEAAGRFEADAEFSGQRPHRRIGRLGDVDERDRLVGAGDADRCRP